MTDINALLDMEDIRDVAAYRLAARHVTQPEWTVIETFARIYDGSAMFEFLVRTANRPTRIIKTMLRDLTKSIKRAQRGAFKIHVGRNGWSLLAKHEFLKQILFSRKAGKRRWKCGT